MERGRIIVIEGTDCSGKETQTTLLVQKLKMAGKRVERLSFPDYMSPTGRIIGESYLGRNGNSFFLEGASSVDPKVASLYYAADRRYHRDYINKLLSDGVDIIVDRYVESNMAHQGGKLFDKEDRLKLYEDLSNLEYSFLEMPKPDIIIFLHVPYKKVLELKNGRLSTDGHENNPIHIRNSINAYLELAELHNYKVIDCVTKDNKLRDIEDINNEIFSDICA